MTLLYQHYEICTKGTIMGMAVLIRNPAWGLAVLSELGVNHVMIQWFMSWFSNSMTRLWRLVELCAGKSSHPFIWQLFFTVSCFWNAFTIAILLQPVATIFRWNVSYNIDTMLLHVRVCLASKAIVLSHSLNSFCSRGGKATPSEKHPRTNVSQCWRGMHGIYIASCCFVQCALAYR